jgi:hypothetical protein
VTTTSTERRIRRRMRTHIAHGRRPPADRAVDVAAAALAEHPGAVVDRVEVDAHGLYAVRLLTTWGEEVVVQVDSDLTVLGWLAFPR